MPATVVYFKTSDTNASYGNPKTSDTNANSKTGVDQIFKITRRLEKFHLSSKTLQIALYTIVGNALSLVQSGISISDYTWPPENLLIFLCFLRSFPLSTFEGIHTIKLHVK